jgi:heme exporter protein D
LGIHFILGLAALGACAALAFQWVLLRSNYLKAIAQQRARHQHQQQATQTQLELAKQQIGRLQHDLSVARMHVKRQVAREPSMAPLREEPRAAPPRHAVPPDGFAETLPALQFPHDISLFKH